MPAAAEDRRDPVIGTRKVAAARHAIDRARVLLFVRLRLRRPGQEITDAAQDCGRAQSPDGAGDAHRRAQRAGDRADGPELPDRRQRDSGDQQADRRALVLASAAAASATTSAAARHVQDDDSVVLAERGRRPRLAEAMVLLERRGQIPTTRHEGEMRPGRVRILLHDRRKTPATRLAVRQDDRLSGWLTVGAEIEDIGHGKAAPR